LPCLLFFVDAMAVAVEFLVVLVVGHLSICRWVTGLLAVSGQKIQIAP
jgi:hypothetical protein